MIGEIIGFILGISIFIIALGITILAGAVLIFTSWIWLDVFIFISTVIVLGLATTSLVFYIID